MGKKKGNVGKKIKGVRKSEGCRKERDKRRNAR